ncbi:dCTP deaminase [Cystobacter ferrugineus]|uniref:Deoxycytidine deaminase n=1 Tax=Cystobacter ferrugineus TaxID=83449 RepID=A0A1L9B131_9BACT|nr:deoxycytidine deaminase [Cystobacter ferrugineus]OJH35970.1 deoxycytidine deaminase [Cystobacter ferrugineus]
MILTGNEIERAVRDGRIDLEPFDPDLLNPNSYNYRLGAEIVELRSDVIDLRGEQRTVKVSIPPEGFRLEPRRVYLGTTLEVIGSDSFVPSLIGRSSLGRLGLFLQITADLGHLGTRHRWTLELKVVQPLIVYPGMRIGQVSFWKPEGADLLEGARYIQQTHSYAHFSEPQPSMFHKLLDDQT